MSQGESLTPLSDLMALDAKVSTQESCEALLHLLCNSEVGVIGSGAPEGFAGQVTSSKDTPLVVGLTSFVPGKEMILAFADPPAFAHRYGARFNATMNGQDVMKAVLYNTECDGVLLNSAQTETSKIISREAIQSFFSPDSGSSKQVHWRRWMFWKARD